MQGYFKEHLRPLAGSAGLHVVLVGVLALAALRWTSQQPPVRCLKAHTDQFAHCPTGRESGKVKSMTQRARLFRLPSAPARAEADFSLLDSVSCVSNNGAQLASAAPR